MSDPCQSISVLSYNYLSSLARSRFTILLQALLAPRKVVARIFEWSERVCSSSSNPSGFLRKLVMMDHGPVLVEEDEGVLDKVVFGCVG